MNIRQLFNSKETTSRLPGLGQRRWVLVTAAVATAIVMTATVSTLLTLRFALPRTTTVSTKVNATNTLAENDFDVYSTTYPTEAVAASGYLEPKDEVIQVSAPAFREGAKVEQLLVQRGDIVEAGDRIAILESRDRLAAALKLAQEQVTIAEAQLAQVKAGAKTGDINAQAATTDQLSAELQGQVSTQEAAIASLQARLQGEETSQQEIIERLATQLTHAETECQRYQSLYQKGAVSASLHDSVCLAEDTTREQLQESEALLASTVNTLIQDIREAEARLSRTVATLQQQQRAAGARLTAISEVRDVDVTLAEAELSRAIAAVEQAQAELDLAYVKAPRRGQILDIHTRPGELVGRSGIVDLGETEQMYAIAEVYETEIHRIRIGQPVHITSTGFPGSLSGSVEDIGIQIGKRDILGTDPTADADARVVEVKIRLQESERVASLTNLEINAVIDVGEQTD